MTSSLLPAHGPLELPPRDFHDDLLDWWSHAPWLALSAAAHLLLFFVLMAIPWSDLQGRRDRSLEVSLPEQVVDEFPDPVEEEVEPVVEDRPLEDPRLLDAEPEDPLDDPAEAEDEGPAETDFTADASLPAEMNEVIGIGGGAPPKFGDRPSGRQRLRRAAGRGAERALVDGLEWLRAHQSGDGSWDADGFATNCGSVGSSRCDGKGEAVWDVGVTGLALLAFLGDGSTTSRGPYREVVRRGIQWLRDQQDRDSGLFGDRNAAEFVYNHALATLAVCEAYGFSHSPLLRQSAQSAVDFIQAARTPYSGWRYDVPSLGDADTSVTGWMLFALASARDAGLAVQTSAFDGGLAWLDEVTDAATGRVGYDAPGTLSSRTPANEHFPRESGETLTAVGLLCRFVLGQDPAEEPIMTRQAELLRRKLPRWDPEGQGCDMYFWYYGSYAMYQMGGDSWRDWSRALNAAVVGSQRPDGDEKGSWDPVGPWGYAGGRVYSTACMVLCLEAYYRYAQILGAR